MSFQSLDLTEQFDAIQADIAFGNESGAITAMGACIFGGGFSLGMEDAGLQVVGHLELPDLALGSDVSMQRWPVAVAPLNDDYPHGDKADIALGNTWLAFADRLKRDGHIPRVVYCNPPCVAFAGTGKHEGTADDRMCYTRYCAYELAMRLEPDVWTWELVPGIFSKERGFLNAMAFRAKMKGYRCYAFLTTSAIHGGYQDRRRFHFVASKYELDFDATYAEEPPERTGVCDLQEALWGLDVERTRVAQEQMNRGMTDEPPSPRLGLLPNDTNLYRGAFNDIFPFVPPGSHVRDLSDDIMHANYRPNGRPWPGSGRPGFAHSRARMDRPCPNVLGGHTIVHPIHDRYLTPRECATVMGFPYHYEFSKGTKAYAEIGKGLCTHNAAFLGRVIKRGLERRIRTVPTLSTEKDQKNSWMQAIDWRNRAKSLSLKMSEKEQKAWFDEKFGGA